MLGRLHVNIINGEALYCLNCDRLNLTILGGHIILVAPCLQLIILKEMFFCMKRFHISHCQRMSCSVSEDRPVCY